jgi:large subunit ribosomal protein L4
MELKRINNIGSAVAVPDDLFALDYNEALIHQIVVAYQANARQGTRAQKNRRDVSHTTKKPWNQKGTGRARAGMSSSPLWRGGGRAFPSMANENFSHKVNTKMYRAGMRSILSQLAREGRLQVVDAIELVSPKTKLLQARLNELNVKTALYLTDEVSESLYLASRNLPKFAAIEARYVDPMSLVHFDQVLITQAGIEQLKEMFA